MRRCVKVSANLGDTKDVRRSFIWFLLLFYFFFSFLIFRHFSVAHALLDLPLFQQRQNPFLLWQQAFGPSPTGKSIEEDDPVDDSALREKQRRHLVPSEVRSGHSVLEARLLQTELLPGFPFSPFLLVVFV